MKYLIVLLCVMVAGCIDKGACLSSHQETVVIPQYMTICDAKGMCTMEFMYSQPVEQTMCDKWEFPRNES